MSVGHIYVMTNPSFPEWIKIGYANDYQQRLADFNNSSCTPFAFRVYCIYEVNERLQDRIIHKLIDTINPSLRSRDTIGNRERIREFYNMSPEDAYSILECIARINGTTEKLKRLEMTSEEEYEEQQANEIAENGNVPPTEHDHLIYTSEHIQELYKKFREYLLEHFSDINVKPTRPYIAFKKNANNICDVKFTRERMDLYINLKRDEMDDPSGIAELCEQGHNGNGEYVIRIYDENTLALSYGLVEQSYNKDRSIRRSPAML